MSTMFRSPEKLNGNEPMDSPLPWFEKSLGGILSCALRETGADKGWIDRSGRCEIHAHVPRPRGVIVPMYQLPIESTREGEPRAAGSSAPHAAQKFEVGPMTLVFEKPGAEMVANCARLHARLDELAQNAELLIDRLQIYWCVKRRLGIDISSIVLGSSGALHSLHAAVQKIARSRLPVFLVAGFGSDALAVAAMLHCRNEHMHRPFVTLRCACQQPHEFQHNLCVAIKKAGGGSLFLSEVDMLSDAMQRDLLSALSFGLEFSATEGEDVRLLASSTCSIDRLVSEGRINRFLCTQLDLLRIEVPPLRDRREDIGPLVEYEIGARLSLRKSVSEEAMQVLERYHWPGDVGELRQTVSRLAVMSDSDRIAVEDIAAHTPLLSTEPAWEPDTPAGPGTSAVSAKAAESDTGNAQPTEGIAELARALAAGDQVDLTPYGIGVQRALLYVSKSYRTEISLAQLAENAYLSPSHLSFLFKKMLGIPFKALLAVVRIEEAKQLLAKNPSLSVTEVSLDCGFGDLSHFERTFKRIVGVNPREFRRRHSAAPPGNGFLLEGKGPPRREREKFRCLQISVNPQKE